MPARSPSVGGIPSRATGLPGAMFATLGVSPAGCLGPNPYHPSPKAVTIPPNQISTSLLLNIGSVASYVILSLSYFASTSTTKTWPLCRQQSSTQPIIKILLTPLTGPDNPLLCHYLFYYLEWIYDNEIFLLWRTKGGNQWVTFPQSDTRIRLVTISSGSQSQGIELDCFT